jgi:hypothetical protein
MPTSSAVRLLTHGDIRHPLAAGHGCLLTLLLLSSEDFGKIHALLYRVIPFPVDADRISGRFLCILNLSMSEEWAFICMEDWLKRFLCLLQLFQVGNLAEPNARAQGCVGEYVCNLPIQKLCDCAANLVASISSIAPDN